jgi:hypothetical protein
MGVRIVFRSGDAPAADAVPAAGTILLPENAVVAVDGARGTFVLERDVVQFRALTLGAVRNGRVVVAAGLAAGTRVVLDPPPTLRSGDRVQLAPH